MSTSDPCHYEIIHQDGNLDRICVEDPSAGFLKPAADLYDDFASAIIESRKPRVDAVEATRVIRWVEACYRQKHERGIPVLAPIPGLTW